VTLYPEVENHSTQMVENVLPHGGTDGVLLDYHQEVAPPIETA
jgi:hypothetical protein